MNDSEEIQNEYYNKTAGTYDEHHANGLNDRQHDFALYVLGGIIQGHDIKTVLDVGAGTGRAMLYLKRNFPALVVNGVEPVFALRDVAIRKGVPEDKIFLGDGSRLPFKDAQFDIVTSFGVLHHVKKPGDVIGEMLRVSKWGIFISDSNNFGQGSFVARTIKQVLNFLRLWRAYDFLRTGGKGYHISDEDGLYYSYSLFNNYSQISENCSRVHLINTESSSNNLYRTAGHIALLGIK